MPARCGSEEEVAGEDLGKVDGLVVAVEVDDDLGVECFWLEMEVLATTHLYFGGQSKAR